MADQHQKITGSQIAGTAKQRIAADSESKANQEIGDSTIGKDASQEVTQNQDTLKIGKYSAQGRLAVLLLTIILVVSLIVWMIVKLAR
jgi:hypothetical protein